MEENIQHKQLILKVLKSDTRLWDEDKTELNQTLLLDLVEKIDEKVITLLLQEQDLRAKFFVKIKDAYVFKTNDFRFFMEENKIDNSYTAYKNRIGLTDGKKFLKDTNDVVLNFPYKDCVLEGGQSTEEGTDTYFECSTKTNEYEQKQSKRKEIFFNSVLAQDEIDRLFDAKALTNWKRFSKDGEQEVKAINRDKNGTIKENLIIKGNNLLALHSLKKQFTGKVKLIYIDPPYNTGNDGFKYNDNFNHSSWLTFMKNRLELARELLRDDGSIFVQCDDNEQAYLKVLMDDIFYFRECIAVKTSTPSGVNAINVKRGEQMFKLKEYLLFYSKNTKYRFNSLLIKNKYNTNYKFQVIKKEDGNFAITDLSKKFNFKELESYCLDNPGKIFSLEKNNKKAGEKIKKIIEKSKDNYLKVIEYINSRNKLVLIYDGGVFIPLAERIANDSGQNYFGVLVSDFWDDEIFQTSSSEGNIDFKNGKKPEKLLKRIIELSTTEGDIILDYHIGSGTTGAVAHKMGRQYIGIEQMDYLETIACERLKKVIGGEQGGISKSANWQGGGDFIYFELAKWNETAKEKILACDNLNELIKFFDAMCEKYFLNYNLKIKEFKEKVIFEDEFKSLSLDEQKKIFIAMLDNNQMYVNKTEMADAKFEIDKQDQNLTSEFYNSEK